LAVGWLETAAALAQDAAIEGAEIMPTGKLMFPTQSAQKEW
jgi:hypothetical protein